MGEIKSNVTVASGVSQSFSQAASQLMAVQTTSTLAERTTVSGNQSAKESGADLVALLQQLSDSIAKDGNNVHSAAQEFEGIDQKIATKLALFQLSPASGGSH